MIATISSWITTVTSWDPRRQRCSQITSDSQAFEVETYNQCRTRQSWIDGLQKFWYVDGNLFAFNTVYCVVTRFGFRSFDLRTLG